MNIIVEKRAYMPQRAHSTDAGLDLLTPIDFSITPRGSTVIDTGIHVELPTGTVGMIKSKSGLNVKKSVVTEGVIDEGYTGSIVVKLYNNSAKTVSFNAGDKITQLVIVPVITPEIHVVDKFDETERGNNGFGSTGV